MHFERDDVAVTKLEADSQLLVSEIGLRFELVEILTEVVWF